MPTIFSSVIHTTNDANKQPAYMQPVAELPDSHLLAIVNLYGSRMGKIKYDLANPVDQMSPVERAMKMAQGFTIPEPPTVENASLTMMNIIQWMQAYVLEGILRPAISEEVLRIWREVIGRAAAVPGTPIPVTAGRGRPHGGPGVFIVAHSPITDRGWQEADLDTDDYAG